MKRKLLCITSTATLVASIGCFDNNSPPDGGCAQPGQATPGPADNHCVGQSVQPTSEADCHPDAGPAADAGASDAGPTSTCTYGDTMFGQEGDDDDCKYHVKWSSTPICEGSVTFTVTATNLTDNSPVANMPGGMIIEPFIPLVPDAACDTVTTHPGPNDGAALTETPPGSGTYVGPVLFNAPGDWTLRFHIHEECADLFPDSPHGHAAFHITVP
jgi:hypothetical protein